MTDKLNASGLKELFGRAMLIKALSFGRPPGKHSRGHSDCYRFHPAGTKLVRRFIRRGRGEQTEYRKLYAYMTGHQYQQKAGT
jgi:hypothetical protein